ncbi:MAG: hypothetical protein B5M53_07210 [Candidatus Cloacimonas sp. 4484_209]|nr:MAG: hypothetical protein B5M53_07210 [Candidatus Cloacimonas sp. 4484_209]
MSEDKMIAFCGIICNECPAYIATKNNDDELKKKVANDWSSDEYPLEPQDVVCHGCLVTNQRMMKFCSECKVRECGLKKGVKNCAYCDEYPCEKLNALWKHLQLPETKELLDRIRKQLSL